MEIDVKSTGATSLMACFGETTSDTALHPSENLAALNVNEKERNRVMTPAFGRLPETSSGPRNEDLRVNHR